MERSQWPFLIRVSEMDSDFVTVGYHIRPTLSTDSLLLIYTGPLTKIEVYEKLKDILDFSNFQKDHPLYDASRMNKLGFWKDECKGQDIQEFAGAASKSYALQISMNNPDDDDDDGDKDEEGCSSSKKIKIREETKCKGIAKGVGKSIPYQAWKDAVLHGTELNVTIYHHVKGS